MLKEEEFWSGWSRPSCLSEESKMSPQKEPKGILPNDVVGLDRFKYNGDVANVFHDGVLLL